MDKTQDTPAKKEVRLTKGSIELLKKDAQEMQRALDDKETHTTTLYTDEYLEYMEFSTNEHTRKKLQELLHGDNTNLEHGE